MADPIQTLAQKLAQPLQGWGFVIPKKGAFVPTLAGSTLAGVTTYVTQQGAYRRLGDRVDFTLTLQWSAATGTGSPRIGGLPYASAAVANQNLSASIYHSAVTFANGSVVVLFSPGVSILRLFSPATNAGGAELVMEAAGIVVISGTYII